MKRTIIFCLFIVGSFTAHSQSWNQFNDSAISLYQNENYKKAIVVGTIAVQKVKIELGENHIDYITCLDNLILYYDADGNYLQAVKLFSESLLIRKKIYGETNPQYATDLNNLGVLYDKQGNIEEALNNYTKALSIYRNTKEGSWIDYINCLKNTAAVFKQKADYAKSLLLYQEMVEACLKEYGDKHLEYAIAIGNLAEMYRTLNEYDKAILLSMEALPIIKKELGVENENYIVILNNLGQSYQEKGDNASALTYLLEAKEGFKKIYGINNIFYAIANQNLGALYKAVGDFNKSLVCLKEGLTVFEKESGKESADYLLCLNNIATVYVSLGNYESALSLFQNVLEIRKRVLGVEHPDYATSLNSIASLYLIQGDYVNAILLYEQVVLVRKKIFGVENPQYATAVENLAIVYLEQGNYTSALKNILESKAIRKKTFGENHPDYSLSLNNLALLYKRQGKLELALPLYLESLKIIKNNFGNNHPDYASRLNNLASTYQSIGDFNKALVSYLEVLDIRKKILGENHPDYLVSLNNLADLYRIQGDFTSALPLFEKVITATQKISGRENPIYAGYLSNLAFLNYDQGKYKEAENLLLEISDIVINYLKKNFNVLSEKEKEFFLNEQVGSFDILQNLLFKLLKPSGSLLKKSLNRQLLLKSMILSDTRNILDVLQNNPDTSLQQLFYKWQSSKRILATQYSLPISFRRTDLSEIEKESENLERTINRKSENFRNIQIVQQLKTDDVQKNLATDEVVLEFVKFDYYNKVWTDSTIYAAYILNKQDSAPVFVPLFEEKQLQKILDSAGKTTTNMVGSFYRGVDLGNDNNTSFLGNDLYKLIWQPLEPYLKGVNKISYSPAGKLHSIAFQALTVDSATLLMDKYELTQYTSTRQVALRSSENQYKKPTGITLFGNASFTMDSTQLAKQKTNKGNISSNIYTPQKRSSDNNVWNLLPGTEEEVDKIKKLFDQNKITSNSFVQTAASEENLKALDGKAPQILHIATHGFFLPEADKKRKENNFNNENTYILADDPLLRSGLILAGGNYAWSGKTPISGVEDGIATAYEISQLNLSNTELVVLSACETALGDVKGSEGVFGLQRAFKMAGVKKMIVSLWQVPDKETAELMTAFYTYWMKGKTINESFAQAQADMRKKYSPFYWAAFVLVE